MSDDPVIRWILVAFVVVMAYLKGRYDSMAKGPF